MAKNLNRLNSNVSQKQFSRQNSKQSMQHSEREELQNIKLGDIVCRKYKLLYKLNQGSFGKIYLAENIQTLDKFAIKVEKVDISKGNSANLTVVREAQVLRALEGTTGFPRLYYFIKNERFATMALSLLGPDLGELFKRCHCKFSLKTVTQIANQAIHRLEYLHSMHYIHRDLKPENFCVGLGAKADVIYLIDFGLSQKFVDSKMNHIANKEDVGMVGTARYVSVRSHLGCEQSRRDDLESLGYVLIYLLKGSLPWSNLPVIGKIEKLRQISDMKQRLSSQELCKRLPEEFASYMDYVKGLLFQDTPNYAFIKKLFRTLEIKCSFEREKKMFDWEDLPDTVENYEIVSALNQQRNSPRKKSLFFTMSKKLNTLNDNDKGLHIKEDLFLKADTVRRRDAGFKKQIQITQREHLPSENSLNINSQNLERQNINNQNIQNSHNQNINVQQPSQNKSNFEYKVSNFEYKVSNSRNSKDSAENRRLGVFFDNKLAQSELLQKNQNNLNQNQNSNVIHPFGPTSQLGNDDADLELQMVLFNRDLDDSKSCEARNDIKNSNKQNESQSYDSKNKIKRVQQKQSSSQSLKRPQNAIIYNQNLNASQAQTAEEDFDEGQTDEFGASQKVWRLVSDLKKQTSQCFFLSYLDFKFNHKSQISQLNKQSIRVNQEILKSHSSHQSNQKSQQSQVPKAQTNFNINLNTQQQQGQQQLSSSQKSQLSQKQLNTFSFQYMIKNIDNTPQENLQQNKLFKQSDSHIMQ